MNKYRTLQGRLNEALDAFRVVSVTGPRQAGKTTLVKEIAAARGLAYASLEDASLRAAADADADGWLDAEVLTLGEHLHAVPLAFLRGTKE